MPAPAMRRAVLFGGERWGRVEGEMVMMVFWGNVECLEVDFFSIAKGWIFFNVV